MSYSYWFSHDSTARHDPKILAMISVYGVQGYAWYFMILEILSEQAGHKIPLNKYTYAMLAAQLRLTPQEVEEFISDCAVEFVSEFGGLLCVNKTSIWSEGLCQRMKRFDETRERRRQSGRARWNIERTTKIEAPQIKTPKIDYDWTLFKFVGELDILIPLWKQKFPALDIEKELGNLEAWLMSNPNKRKSNYSRFITNCLKGNQDRARNTGGSRSHAPTADEIEKEIGKA